MKRWLVILLALVTLILHGQRVDSQNMDVGNALPCGDGNLSCLNVFDADDPNDCLTTAQLCNGVSDCDGAIDEDGLNGKTIMYMYIIPFVACSCLILFI